MGWFGPSAREKRDNDVDYLIFYANRIGDSGHVSEARAVAAAADTIRQKNIGHRDIVSYLRSYADQIGRKGHASEARAVLGAARVMQEDGRR